jgi:hypothetical protein
MNDLLPITKLLYCSWLLSGTTDEEKTSFPSSRGVIDYALKMVVEKGGFPTWMREKLHFVNANLGFVCEELPQIQNLATNAKLTSDPNPSYITTEIVVGEMYANRTLGKLGISRGEAEQWGRELRRAVEEIAAKFAA